MLWRWNRVRRVRKTGQRSLLPPLLYLLVAAFLLAFGVYLSLLGIKVARTYEDLQEGKSLLLTAEAALRAGGLEIEPPQADAAEAGMLEAQRRLRRAHGALAGEPLVRAGRRLPWLGDQLDALVGLAEIGVYGSDIGLTGIAVLREFQAARDRQDGSIGETAAAFLQRIEPEIEAVDAKVAAVQQIRGSIAAPLLPPLAGVVDTVDERITEVREETERYGHARTAVNAVLGFDRPKRYLVLGQDNTELFPTGGIIAVYGTVTFDQGRLVQRSFRSAILLVEEWRAAGDPYVAPPGPLDDYLLHGWTWNFVLANWSPDFPTAARRALWFYEQAGGEPVDGVLGIDFDTLEGLLALTGPVTLAEYGLTLDESNVTEALQLRIHRPQAPAEEADYAVAVAAADRILDAAWTLDGDRAAEALRALEGLVREKHLFVYSAGRPVASALAALGWDGGLAPLASDYVMPVEASVHSTKLNLVVEADLDLRVALSRDGSARHQLDMRYRNQLDQWARGRDAALVSALMLDGFYGGYLRLLVPPQATLDEVLMDGRAVGVEEVSLERGRLAFGRYFPLPRGARRRLTFAYKVPLAVDTVDGGKEYRLYVQKQGGLDSPPLRISIELPQGAGLRWVSLDGQRLPGAPLEIATDLSRDREVVVRYRE